MTPEEHRQLNARVAERVMELRLSDNRESIYEDRLYEEIPDYSRDITAAWDLVQKVGETHPFFHLYRDARNDEPYWFCDWSNEFRSGLGAKGNTAPLAICLAALKAVGELTPVSQTQ